VAFPVCNCKSKGVELTVEPKKEVWGTMANSRIPMAMNSSFQAGKPDTVL
jgi:hypothetical protein